MKTRRSLAALRVALLVLAALLSALAVASLRVAYLGKSALRDAEAAFDRGDLHAAIESARRAAAMRVPGASHADAAFARLIVVARGAEAVGENEVALEAWEAVRGATLESRLPFFSGSDELSLANQHLARLRAESVRPRDSVERARALESELFRSLERAPEQTGPRTALVALGFALAVAGCALAGLRGVSREGTLRKRELVLGGMLLSAGVACWTFAVGLA